MVGILLAYNIALSQLIAGQPYRKGQARSRSGLQSNCYLLSAILSRSNLGENARLDPLQFPTPLSKEKYARYRQYRKRDRNGNENAGCADPKVIG